MDDKREQQPGAAIDPKAIDSLSIAPDRDDAEREQDAEEQAANAHGNPNATAFSPTQDAGRDASIEQRLKRDPGNEDAQLDRGSDESMDASDPPSAALRGITEPPLSSGYDEEAERQRANDQG